MYPKTVVIWSVNVEEVALIKVQVTFAEYMYNWYFTGKNTISIPTEDLAMRILLACWVPRILTVGLTGITALCPKARHINTCLVLVQQRKARPDITEKPVSQNLKYGPMTIYFESGSHFCYYSNVKR